MSAARPKGERYRWSWTASNSRTEGQRGTGRRRGRKRGAGSQGEGQDEMEIPTRTVSSRGYAMRFHRNCHQQSPRRGCSQYDDKFPGGGKKKPKKLTKCSVVKREEVES